jgi:hypothetical protein
LTPIICNSDFKLAATIQLSSTSNTRKPLSVTKLAGSELPVGEIFVIEIASYNAKFRLIDSAALIGFGDSLR